MTTSTRPGLFTAAIAYSEHLPGSAGELHQAAMAAALRYLASTGEALRSASDVLLLLGQAADDPCIGHCGDAPICAEHEL